MIALLFLFLFVLASKSSSISSFGTQIARANSAAAICFEPDGSIDVSATPCSTISSKATFCCKPGWACLDEQICMLTDHAPEWNGTAIYLRGSCTDPHWGSNCPNFCVANSTIGNAVSNDCTSDEKPSFCCSNLGPNCLCDADNNSWFLHEAPAILTTIPYTESTATPFASSTQSIEVLTIEVTTRSTESGASVVTFIGGVQTIQPTTSGTLTSASSSYSSTTSFEGPAQTSSSPQSPPKDHNAPDPSLAVGLGVGIPAFLVILVILGFYIYRHYRNRRGDGTEDMGLDGNGIEALTPYEDLVHEKDGNGVERAELDGLHEGRVYEMA